MEIPRYQARVGIPGVPQRRLLSASDFGAGAEGLGSVAEAFGAVAEVAAEQDRARQREAARLQRMSDANISTEATAEILEGIAALPDGDATSPDFIVNRDKEVSGIISQVMQKLPALPNGKLEISDEAKSDLENKAREIASRDRIGSIDRKRGADRARAEDNIDRELNVITAAARRLPSGLPDALAALDQMLTPYIGALTADTLRDRRAEGQEKIIKSFIRGRVQSGDFGVVDEILMSQDFNAMITPETRETLLGEVESETRAYLSDLDANDARAKKRLRETGDKALKNLYGLHADGKLSRRDVDAVKPYVSPSEFSGLLDLVDGDGPENDDNDALIDLTARLATEDVTGDAARYLRAGRLTASTYRSIVQRNRTALGDARPASPYKSARSRVTLTLDPSQLLTGAAAKVARVGLANALVEIDDFADANPQLGRAEYQAEARAIITRYQTVIFDEMKLSQGLPRFYSGTRDALDTPSLDQAERRALDKFDAGEFSKTQLLEELGKIENWRGILSMKGGRALTTEGPIGAPSNPARPK